MLTVLISWGYMFLLCMILGMGILKLMQKLLGRDAHPGKKAYGVTDMVMAGILGVTVYTEYVSLFGKIGMAAQLGMLALGLCSMWLTRQELAALLRKMGKEMISWEGLFYLGFLLFLAFFTSRGEFHTDTNIYHAQAIRMYEEYGVLKGSGNLQLHYGYNSAGLAFSAFFSLNWLLGAPLHTTTGFLEAVLGIYAFHGLKDFRIHTKHKADMMRVGILFYILIILVRSMSPATDYSTMLLTFYVLSAWCVELEGAKAEENYALLSVYAVLLITYKFSACFLVLLAVYPAVCLICRRKWQQIGILILCGVLVLAPFLIRNYLISGWLLYPFGGIDLFHPVWKVPREYLQVDADQIKVWGRCLFDIKKTDAPLSEWLPVWWSDKERYEQMFLGGVGIGAVLLLAQFVRRRLRREKWDPAYAAFLLAVAANLLTWFFMAPFIRYGLAFLLAVPLLAVGVWLEESRKGFYSILSGCLLFGIVITLSAYWQPYITYAGVFVKQNFRQPYYLTQQEYDRGEVGSLEINGNTIYYNSGTEEINSYYYFPNTCYGWMLERSTLIGDRIEDGFRAK